METFVDESGVFARLPASSYRTPRAKPVPSEKALTKWERFAKGKGIQKRKKDKYAFDDDKGEERPRYGYQSARNDPLNNWLVEVPKGGDVMADYIAKAGEDKKTKVDKNKKQQLKNEQGGLNKYHIANQSMNDKNNAKLAKLNALNSKISSAKYSTASMGKFDKAIQMEDKIASKGKKRKYESNTGDKKHESERVKKIATHVAGTK